MFSNEELENWCNKLNLKESARRLIKEIRSTEPVRQVGSSFNNVSGNYATSSKMGKIIKRTGRPLGRPWATLLIDAYSRRILAVYLTFDEPSYRSCMMVVRICVQRFSRLPKKGSYAAMLLC